MIRRATKRIILGLGITVVLAVGYFSPTLFSWQTVTISNNGTEQLTVRIYDHVWTVDPENTATFHFRSNRGDADFQIENGEILERKGYVTASLPSCHEVAAPDGAPVEFRLVTGKLCHLRW